MRDGPEQVYVLADEIRERCIRGPGSLLTPGEPVWTSEAASELVAHFWNTPDTGGGSILVKLRSQLTGVSPKAVQLMAVGMP